MSNLKLLAALASPTYVTVVSGIAGLLVTIVQPFGLAPDPTQLAGALLGIHTLAVLVEKLTAGRPTTVVPEPQLSPGAKAIADAITSATVAIESAAARAATDSAQAVLAAVQGAPTPQEPAVPVAPASAPVVGQS